MAADDWAYPSRRPAGSAPCRKDVIDLADRHGLEPATVSGAADLATPTLRADAEELVELAVDFGKQVITASSGTHSISSTSNASPSKPGPSARHMRPDPFPVHEVNSIAEQVRWPTGTTSAPVSSAPGSARGPPPNGPRVALFPSSDGSR
ncbi:hypothetical protein GCM10009753_09620 [Streptantibioticus ferralitis]